MRPYVILTDSACDIAPSLLQEWGIAALPLTFRFEGEDGEYLDGAIPSAEFYDMMRQGKVARTSAINIESFRAFFEPYLAQGSDILYIGFSSGLSVTYSCAQAAAGLLADQYPDAKILTVDSLCASAGFGLLVAIAARKKAEGIDIEQLAQEIRTYVPRMCHWFTVEDLVYLKRGGRVSPSAAFFGNMLGIKPVLHMDGEGHLIPRAKVRGRRASIVALAEQYGLLLEDPSVNEVFISHGDCLSDAELLKSILEEKYGANVTLITSIGPVIGSHSGPGTLAVFFIGKQR